MSKKLIDDVVYLESHIKNCKFDVLKLICERWFGDPRVNGDHFFYSTPWEGDPLINIQPDKKNKKSSKKYQVRQVKRALNRLAELRSNS